MRGQILGLSLCLVLCVQSIHADEVIFKNGDRLTGKIEHLADGKLVFKSNVAGTVTVDISDVQTLSSDAPITVHLKDETVLKQKVAKAGPNRFAIEGSETLEAQEFGLAAISSINPPAKPKPKWLGDISAGLTSTHGNTKTETVSASANLRKRTEKDRTQVSADYARGRQRDTNTGQMETTEDWWRTKGKYDYFLTKKLYGYVDGRYEKDAIAQLDRRVIAGGGGGYQWIESEDMSFSTEGGFASLYEKFDNQTTSNSEVSVQAGYNFDKQLMKKVKFIHDLTWYPSTEKFSDYYLTSTGEIRAHFTDRMFTNFKAIFDYDSTPAIGAGNTDVKYIWGIGWSF
jgi:putative salt-induced outer membrane protein YdiY